MKYELPRDGIDAQVQREQERADVIRDLRGSNKAESIVVTGSEGFTAENVSAGTRARLAGGAVTFWDETADEGALPGTIRASAGNRSLYLYPPRSEGPLSANYVAVNGRETGVAGNVIARADGYITLAVSDADGDKAGVLNLSAGDLILDATRIMPYGLGTVSSSANLVVDFPGGFPVLKLSTSSLRYKQDVVDAEIDTDAVLCWRPRAWRDKNAVEEQGDDAPKHIGFIAEEIYEATPEFVVLDDQGRPDSLKYDRMTAGLVALVQKQAEQIADLTARIDALEAQ